MRAGLAAVIADSRPACIPVTGEHRTWTTGRWARRRPKTFSAGGLPQLRLPRQRKRRIRSSGSKDYRPAESGRAVPVCARSPSSKTSAISEGLRSRPTRGCAHGLARAAKEAGGGLRGSMTRWGVFFSAAFAGGLGLAGSPGKRGGGQGVGGDRRRTTTSWSAA